jgi:hypothetical protein
MAATIRTIVAFEISVFNATVSKQYNPCCFGDDVATWLHEADEQPGQEDSGWYFTFRISGPSYCFVVGYRAADPDNEEAGFWIGWGTTRRTVRISFWWPQGWHRPFRHASSSRNLVQLAILSNSPRISNIRWHFEHGFTNGLEELGTPGPALGYSRSSELPLKPGK